MSSKYKRISNATKVIFFQEPTFKFFNKKESLLNYNNFRKHLATISKNAPVQPIAQGRLFVYLLTVYSIYRKFF